MSSPIEPPSESPPTAELIERAEVALRNYLVAKSQALQADGCCSADTWRGHLCPYHQGYADGIDELIETQRRVASLAGPTSPLDGLRWLHEVEPDRWSISDRD